MEFGWFVPRSISWSVDHGQPNVHLVFLSGFSATFHQVKNREEQSIEEQPQEKNVKRKEQIKI